MSLTELASRLCSGWFLNVLYVIAVYLYKKRIRLLLERRDLEWSVCI